MSEISGDQFQTPVVLFWAATQASYEFTGSAPNSGIVFTAVDTGLAGNNINVNVEAADQTEALSVDVDATTITIRPETSGSFQSLSTASQMMAAVNADPEASLLVVASLAVGSNGSGIIDDGELDQNLSGGLDQGSGTFPAFFATDNQLLVFDPDKNIRGINNTLELSGDITGSGPAAGGGFTTTLADTGVDPDTYTNPTVTFDSKGRATSAANGAAPFLFPIVTTSNPTTGQTVSAGVTGADETLGIAPATSLAALTIELPATANTRVGQIIRVFINQIVTTLTITANGSGAGDGPLPDTSAPDSMFAYQAITTSSWRRIQ